MFDIPVDTTQNPYDRSFNIHNCSIIAFTGILSLIGLFMLTPAHKTQHPKTKQKKLNKIYKMKWNKLKMQSYFFLLKINFCDKWNYMP